MLDACGAGPELRSDVYKVLFTSDYEIHGSGTGSPHSLVVEPTRRMLDQLDRHGAKLTIMADAGEISKFKEWTETHSDDRFDWGAIAAQLRHAVSTGHDVQLHIHSSYFNAAWDEEAGRWAQDWSEYDLTSLSYERVREMIHAGKQLLEEICRVAKPDYECFAFRAANWSMQPSQRIVRALVDEGFRIDTSVWKHGRYDDFVRFDYSGAHGDLVPWPIDERDVCVRDPRGELFEFPIYTERRPLWVFVTANRLYRVVAQRLHPLPAPEMTSNTAARAPGSLARKALRKASMLVRKHPWKMDFNQCTGRQLIEGLQRVEKRYGHPDVPLPFVLIGHSKTFTKHNERVLRPFLEYVAEHPDRYSFATFGEIDVEQYRRGSG
jgi:hypothetical protein